jgi:anti-anti-sigma regulatory factor
MSGRLDGESTAEARRVCSSAAAPLLVDASELHDMGADGTALLADLMAEGAKVEGLSGYLTMRVRNLQEEREHPLGRDRWRPKET